MVLWIELAESSLLAENIGLTKISSLCSSASSRHITGISFLFGGKRVPLFEEKMNRLLLGFVLNIRDFCEATAYCWFLAELRGWFCSWILINCGLFRAVMKFFYDADMLHRKSLTHLSPVPSLSSLFTLLRIFFTSLFVLNWSSTFVTSVWSFTCCYLFTAPCNLSRALADILFYLIHAFW